MTPHVSLVTHASLVADPEVPKLEENHLFMPAWGYGLLAVCIFLALFALLWAFRNTAERFGTPKGHGPADVRGGGQNQGVNH